jgi:hypothetical protein
MERKQPNTPPGSRRSWPDNWTGHQYQDFPFTDMQQKPLSDNHPALNGMRQPMLLSPPVQKQRVTVSLSVPLIERLRNAVYWTEPISLVKLFTEALEEIVTEMEEVNGGAFPQRVSPLKRGRRRGPCAPAHSTPTHSHNSAHTKTLSS